jgi:hypothetical protein
MNKEIKEKEVISVEGSWVKLSWYVGIRPPLTLLCQNK